MPGPSTPTDEELARRSYGGSLESITALLERYHAALDRLVYWWSSGRGLRPEELEDGLQEARVGFLLAVTAFGEDRGRCPRRARFRTLLNQVVRNRLNKWDRGRQRAESHYDRSADWATELEHRAGNPPWEAAGLPLPDPESQDPADLAQWQEFWARLRAGVERLDSTGRCLWERLQEGRSLHEFAGEQDLFYDRAKRLRRQVLARLREAVL
jgi:hypothetical protein